MNERFSEISRVIGCGEARDFHVHTGFRIREHQMLIAETPAGEYAFKTRAPQDIR
jgi:hypothetical protein